MRASEAIHIIYGKERDEDEFPFTLENGVLRDAKGNPQMPWQQRKRKLETKQKIKRKKRNNRKHRYHLNGE